MNQTTMATPKGPETFPVGNRRTTTTEPPASRAALVAMPFDGGRTLVNGGIETHSHAVPIRPSRNLPLERPPGHGAWAKSPVPGGPRDLCPIL